jgi:hypothetical protein
MVRGLPNSREDQEAVVSDVAAAGPLLSSVRGRFHRPRLRDPEPVQELHRKIDAGTHRFLVGTALFEEIR